MQAADAVAGGLAHPANLAVPALVQHELEARCAEPPHARRGCDAVLELDALGEPAQHLVGRLAPGLDLIDLLDPVARMRELVRERTVVREQERARRFDIEPADGNHAGLVLDELDDRRPTLGVARRRHDACRLVQKHVCEPLLRDGLAVHENDRAGLDECVQLAGVAVHLARDRP